MLKSVRTKSAKLIKIRKSRVKVVQAPLTLPSICNAAMHQQPAQFLSELF